ncbi:DUF1351 domain-containing protein [Capnocytophaga sp. oral taxon 338]|uniref:DUF1351 domain-containing protein n=1 Tax=Capnocytophaga sp. oral taxon 338 TaxID=710239 RepID=UPI000202D1A4|nr:DUF1351 domain-containing protein [Capnocytophaga sp. oral taxon 338]EGD33303.1 hypothetical protein HMPREF9071_2097 [Capnocytophaga sp. oral taxon 338 str. F0234]
MNENLITVQQLPVILYERIESVGQEIDKRIAALELDKQLVTEETKKSVKETRAMLNKELKDFEEQRKRIKEQVAAPYVAFEKAYNTFIKERYEKAEGILKVKIDEFDNRLKADKEARIKAYFAELCQANNIDFLPFERLGLKINTTTIDKNLQDLTNGYIDNVVKSLEFIDSLNETAEYKAEILTEYKQTLDVTSAMRNAQYRKQQREYELQRLEAQKARAAQAKEAAEAKEVTPLQAPEEVKREERIEKKEEEPATEEVIQTSFTVQGTYEQLKALKAYIISNNIKIL